MSFQEINIKLDIIDKKLNELKELKELNKLKKVDNFTKIFTLRLFLGCFSSLIIENYINNDEITSSFAKEYIIIFLNELIIELILTYS